MNTAAEYAKRVNRSTDVRLTEEDAQKLLRIAQDTLHEDLVQRRKDYYRHMVELAKPANIEYLQTR